MPKENQKYELFFPPSCGAWGDRLIYRVRGSGFLKHMVRNIVGTLIAAGKGNIEDLANLPVRSGPTAPARGLFLVRVEY
jgi:tRNA pseudouridine38-40 synthase